MSSVVLSGQSFFDKALEISGSVENAFELALLNGLSITDNLVVGNQLVQSSVSNKAVVSFFEDTKPSTALTVVSLELISDDNLGIGAMNIENTFIVR